MAIVPATFFLFALSVGARVSSDDAPASPSPLDGVVGGSTMVAKMPATFAPTQTYTALPSSHDETVSASDSQTLTSTATATVVLTSTVRGGGTVTSTLSSGAGSLAAGDTITGMSGSMSTSTRVHTIVVTAEPVKSVTVTTTLSGGEGASSAGKVSRVAPGKGVWMVLVAMVHQLVM